MSPTLEDQSRPRGSRRLILAAVAAAIVLLAVIFIEVQWHPGGFYIADKLYDNVPQYAGCSKFVSSPEAQQVLKALTIPSEVEAFVTDRCGGKSGIEFQYPSHEVRLNLEEVLKRHGQWKEGCGWFLRQVPVELRNI